VFPVARGAGGTPLTPPARCPTRASPPWVATHTCRWISGLYQHIMASSKLPAHHVKTLLGGTRFRSPWSTWQAREGGGPGNTPPPARVERHLAAFPHPLAPHPRLCPPHRTAPLLYYPHLLTPTTPRCCFHTHRTGEQATCTGGGRNAAKRHAPLVSSVSLSRIHTRCASHTHARMQTRTHTHVPLVTRACPTPAGCFRRLTRLQSSLRPHSLCLHQRGAL
jgi:hypothetical protein